jgi:molecular chaperone GrpE
MIEGETIEQLLQQFRGWLEQTHREAAQADTNQHYIGGPPRAGLDRLVEEFTALRHEIKLQTRSARSLEERVENSLSLLGESTAALQSAAAREHASSTTSDKSFAVALADLDEALDRAREQWEKSAPRLSGEMPSLLSARLAELDASQPWWRRLLNAACFRQARVAIDQMEEQAQAERVRILQALAGGYALIQQRLAKSMVQAGVLRIRAQGQQVDPERMIVVEVAPDDGPPGQVVEEVRRGYMWQGQVLRAAEVRAIRQPMEAASPEPA